MNITIPKKIFKEEGQRNTAVTVVAVFLLAFLTAAFNDSLTPFRSFFFLLGSAAIYYAALHFGVHCSLMLACCMGTLMLLQSLTSEKATFHLLEVPPTWLFFLWLALVPALRPALYAGALERLKREGEMLEEKDRELTARLGLAQKSKVSTMRELVEQYDMRYSSRNATLVSFSREVVRLPSPHEVVHSLFKTFTRTLQDFEILQLVPAEQPGEMVVAHFFPPKQKAYLNLAVPTTDEALAAVLSGKTPLASDEGKTVGGSLTTQLLAPCVQADGVLAVLSFHQPGTALDEEDEQFIIAMVGIANAALARLEAHAGQGGA